MSFFKIIILLVVSAIFLGGCGENSNPTTLLNATVSALESENFSNACSLAEKAINANSQNPDAYILGAIAYMNNNKIEKAVELARKATQLAPDSFIVQFTLGNVASHDRASNYDALVALGKALELKPNDQDTIILLANVNMKFNPKQAFKYLIRLQHNMDIQNSAAYQNQMGICLIQQSSDANAAKAFLKSCRLAPDVAIGYYNLALCMDQYLNRPTTALPLYKKYLTLSNESGGNSQPRKYAEARVKALSK